MLESSHNDDSNKWSNIGFGKEIMQAVSIEEKLCILSGALMEGKATLLKYIQGSRYVGNIISIVPISSQILCLTTY